MYATRLIGMLVGAAFLVGCASSTEWVHPRKSKDAFTQDYSRCENTMMLDPKVQAATASGSKFMLQVSIEKCLHKEGWMQVEQPN